jgi:hypothetical protein
MSFEWRGADASFPCTHGGMTQIAFALAFCGGTDGPPSSMLAHWWMRNKKGVLPDAAGRVRVMALRNNDARLTADECRIIASKLGGLTQTDEMWARFGRMTQATPELRELLAEFAAFCVRCWRAETGCVDGDGSEDAKPYAEVIRDRLSVAFVENAKMPAQVELRCVLAADLAQRKFDERLSFDAEGFGALDRITEKSVGCDEGGEVATREAAHAFASHYLESIRRLHAGTWGVHGPDGTMEAGLPALRLPSGLVLDQVDFARRFYLETTHDAFYTLRQFGEAPYPAI